MVMKLHTGVPGSGKSYLLVKSFIDSFCTYDKNYGEWKIKPTGKLFRLISNIEGLTIPHESLDVLISDRCRALARVQVLADLKKVYAGDAEEFLSMMEDAVHVKYLELLEEKVRWFFTDEYQKSLADGCTLVYLVEECQRYFDTTELGRKVWVRDVLYFFERHRHHGISFFMDTQHVSKIHKGIAVLFEEEIQAKPRTLSITGEFRYNSMCDGLKTNQFPIVVRPDKRIFSAYQSRTSLEAVKPKTPVKRLLIAIAICPFIVYVFYLYARHTIAPSVAVASPAPDATSAPAPGAAHGVVPGSAPGAGSVPAPGSGAVPAPGVVPVPAPGEWVRTSYVIKPDGQVWAIHPKSNAVCLLGDLGLKTKILGEELYSFVE